MVRPIVAALALAFATLAAGGAQAEGWRRYHNTRFGVTADYPAGWTMAPEPENNDGHIFFSPDGQARVIISGIFATEPRAEEFAERSAPTAGESLTYKAQKGDWIILSGTRGDRVFYRKSLLSCQDKVWNDIEIDYPIKDKAKYDALVAHIAASLKPGSGYNLQCK